MNKSRSQDATRGAWLVVGLITAGLYGCDTAQSIVGVRDATVADDAPDGAPDVTDDAPDAAPDAAPEAGMDAGMDAGDGGADVTSDMPVDVPPDLPPLPTLAARAVAQCGTVCVRPLDAVPNAGGSVVYFTAFTPDGTPGVFRFAVPLPGAPAATPVLITPMSGGMEFPAGIAISNDDATLYVADLAAVRGDEDGAGAIFSVSVLGGTPARVTMPAEFVHPSALAVTADNADLLVSGERETDMGAQKVIFRMSRGGGMATVLTSDVVEPSGIALSPTGAVLAFDVRRGGGRSGSAVTVGAMAVTEVAGGFVANFPAGLAYFRDSQNFLVSGVGPDGQGLLTLVSADGRTSSPAALSMEMESPLGLHRARTNNQWAVADETAGDTGRIFIVSLQ